jgi:hypothetical protein
MLAAAGPVAAQDAEVRICDRPNLNGQCIDLRHGVGDLRQFGLDNRVTSFEIRAGRWLMCSERGFGGQCVTFDASVRNLRRSGFNNTVASLRPVRRGDRGPNAWRTSITLYEEANYRGRAWTFADDTRDLSRFGMNNRVSSVRVNGGRWNLCLDVDFARCERIDASIPRLREPGLNNKISSIEEIGRRGRRN